MADQDNPQPPAGWYPDPTQPGQQRYWDGTQWTEHTAPGTGDGGASAASGRTTTPTGSGAYGTAGTYGSGTSGAAAAGGAKPDPWLWQSIVATVLCCLPLGIVAIVFAAQAQSAIGIGDYASAREKAGKAKTWTLASVGVGLVLVVGWLVLVFAGIGMGGFESGQF